MKYIAFITKGIEAICSKELKSIEGLDIVSVDQKFITFEYSGDPEKLKELRTIDDIGIMITAFEVITYKDDLDPHTLCINEIKNSYIPFISSIRSLQDSFSVTTSFYKTTLDRVNFKSDVIKVLSNNLGLNYKPLDHSNLDFRVNVDGDKVIVSLKLFERSLYKRGYDHTAGLGSIRSTIAAAMIYEISEHSKDITSPKLVDNFCGSGTFLCEAIKQGFDIYGGDLSMQKVDLSKVNLKKVGIKEYPVFQVDASKTKWESKYFDVAVSNFPWGKQIKGGASIGLLGVQPDLIKKFLKQYFPKHRITEYRIGFQGQTPSIVFAFP
jgi:23S rRNA G2445 N2-methylase RlmL